ncbi:OstA-like protein [Aurantibacillus circumpalustris]|uniref:OstA-like protein n=1 Tax=Aurantibacillus circumpalustris TaxID=3036359 RepID=UPI00295B6F80|nr:OstA-like protein [Aurantibacillus circumpalustris]
MFKRVIHTIIFFVLFLVASGQTSKKQIQVRNADNLTYDESKNSAKVLSGHVICEHEGALLYCDTAYIYSETNQMIARGNILITKGDSITVTGDRLLYDGKTRIATLERNVKCVEKDMTLTTNLLTFDVGASVANYYNGGTIVNKENTLVSKNGHYYSATKEATFHYDVVLTNPDYKMNSDTLKYKVPTRTSYFLGPSIILSKSDYIYCENGWYDTNKENAAFSKNAVLVTSQQKLRGDSLFYDRTLKYGRAFRNVTMVDTSQKSIIYGDYVEYRELKSEALVTKKAIYARILEEDTVFIAADTLYHRDIDSVNNFLNAFHHVKIFKKNLQAICDSATMNTQDSLMQLFNTPVLWSTNAQATSKIIKVDIGKNKIKGFHLEGKAFLIQQVDSLHNKDKYNQLAGKTIDGIITEDSIRRVIVSGSAEIMYYPKNESKLIGLNKTGCTEIYMWLKKGEMDRVAMKPKTEGNIDPVKDVDIENAKLKGFNWQYSKRPLSRFELHSKPKEGLKN